jgi:phosphatidylinositol 4-kinase
VPESSESHPSSPDYYDAWVHLSAIFHSPKDKKVGDAAYEALKESDIDFYLPQLCLLLAHLDSTSEALERLVLERCARSLHFTIRCIFCLGAMAPSNQEPHQQLIERIENYQYACQLAYINNKMPILEQNANPLVNHSKNDPTEETNLDSGIAFNRDERFKYLTSLKHFMKELSEIGTELGSVEEGERIANLRSKISILNSKLSPSASEPSSIQYVTGLFLPFSSSDEPHYSILRIPEHEISILPSRNRVPFSICFETISISPSQLLSTPRMTALVPEYENEIQKLLTEQMAVPSPDTAKSRSVAIGSTESPPRVRMPTSLEAPENESPASHLKRILSVPQNSISVRTKEKWASKEARVKKHSIYGQHFNWKLRGAIVKYGSDGLQEQLSLHLLQLFAHIFEITPSCRARLITYHCIVVENEATLIEPLLNAESIHQIKKNNNNITLDDFFAKKWSKSSSTQYAAAQRRFLITLAGSSLVSYLLQLKDRHNANIMIDDDGNLTHIDWGFLLYNTPGAIGFETAPFKLSSEMVAVLGGPDSQNYRDFQAIFHEAFMALRKRASQILDMVKIMFLCDPTRVPCAAGGQEAIDDLRDRFVLHMSESECITHTQSLISQSYNNWRTLNYDYFQYYTNGILS